MYNINRRLAALQKEIDAKPKLGTTPQDVLDFNNRVGRYVDQTTHGSFCPEERPCAACYCNKGPCLAAKPTARRAMATKYLCDTCRDTGEAMAAVYEGGCHHERMLPCPDCDGPEELGAPPAVALNPEGVTPSLNWAHTFRVGDLVEVIEKCHIPLGMQGVIADISAGGNVWFYTSTSTVPALRYSRSSSLKHVTKKAEQ